MSGPDRVRVSGVRGSPGPPTTKVCINFDGGYRNRMTFVLTGLNQPAKAAWAQSALFARLGGADRFDEVDVRFVEAPSDAAGQEASSGRLHVTVKSADERLVGRAFSSAAVELALANYPGFFVSSPPTDAQPFGVYWPALVSNDEVHQVVVLADGTRLAVERSPVVGERVIPAVRSRACRRRCAHRSDHQRVSRWACTSVRAPATRAATPTSASGRPMAPGTHGSTTNLTAEAIARLLPEAAGLEIRRYELPNLFALNFVIVGYLGEGVASSTAFDTQAKGLGEYLRSRIWTP